MWVDTEAASANFLESIKDQMSLSDFIVSLDMKLFTTVIILLALANFSLARPFFGPYMASWNQEPTDADLMQDEAFKKVFVKRIMDIFPGLAQQMYKTFKQSLNDETTTTTEATTSQATTTVPAIRKTIQIYLPPKPAFSPYG